MRGAPLTSDRLRDAADRLDGEEDGYWPADITLWPSDQERDYSSIDAGPLADLLRAVAWDWADSDADHDARTIKAALALADAILGEGA